MICRRLGVFLLMGFSLLTLANRNGHSRFSSIFGGFAGGGIAQWKRYIPQIAALEEPLKLQSDFDLKKASLSLRYRARSEEVPAA